MSTLKFKCSRRSYSVFISHALPSFLANVTPVEAAEYVLPLLPSLAMDEGTSRPRLSDAYVTSHTDETVKEALASELVEILWWFLTVSLDFLACCHLSR